MDSSSTLTGTDVPVERFKPTSGYLLGYAGLALILVGLGYVVLSVHTVTGLRVGLAAVFATVLVWATQIRPRAVAYREALLLRNSFTDTRVPLRMVDAVTLRQTLNIWVGDARYVCIGIGEGLRARRKGSGNRPKLLGTSRWHEFSEMADRAAPDQTGMTYHAFVVRRIEELVESAKKAELSESSEPALVRRRVALPEIVVLVVSGLGFLVSLLF